MSLIGLSLKQACTGLQPIMPIPCRNLKMFLFPEINGGTTLITQVSHPSAAPKSWDICLVLKVREKGIVIKL